MTIPYDRLNESQKRAVSNPAPRLLVSAGPGTGKTEALAHRIVYMINHWDVLPQEILAVTFSRKAAQEMRDRVADVIGEVSKDVRISTLHSESLRTLSGMNAASRFFVSDYEARMLMQDALRIVDFQIR
jgi:superfamily I DNA/RNA helicase